MPDEEEILSWPIWAVVPTCLAIVFPLIAEPFINLIAKASVMHSLACGIVTVARTMSPSFGLFLAINIDVALAVYSGNHHETALTLSCYCRSCIDAARAAIFGLKRATDLLLTVTFWTFDALSDIIGELPALYVSLILLVGLCNLAAAVYIAFPLALLREVVGNLNYYRFVDAILSTGGRMARTLLGLAGMSLPSGTFSTSVSH